MPGLCWWINWYRGELTDKDRWSQEVPDEVDWKTDLQRCCEENGWVIWADKRKVQPDHMKLMNWTATFTFSQSTAIKLTTLPRKIRCNHQYRQKRVSPGQLCTGFCRWRRASRISCRRQRRERWKLALKEARFRSNTCKGGELEVELDDLVSKKPSPRGGGVCYKNLVSKKLLPREMRTRAAAYSQPFHSSCCSSTKAMKRLITCDVFILYSHLVSTWEFLT